MSDLINPKKISLIGAKSEQLARELAIEAITLEECDVALFLVSAKDGIISADLQRWRQARDLYIPSLVIICDLLSSEIDFDDMTAIAGKMLDPIVTPFLVLHSDEGIPVALINLETLKISDYSSGVKIEGDAEVEHIELVAEFREEYLEDLKEAGDDAFTAGLLFPALPWIEGSKIGLEQIIEYLNKVPALS